MVTGQQVAQIFSVAARTVRSWHTDLGMPKSGVDKYDLRIVVPWKLGQERKEAEARVPEIARTRVAHADEKEEKAIITRINRQKLEETLIERAGVEDQWLALAYAMKTGLSYLDLVLGRRLEGVTETAEIEAVVAEEVERCLLAFASEDEQWQAGKELARRIADRVAPAVTKGKRIEKVKNIIEKLLGEDPWANGAAADRT